MVAEVREQLIQHACPENMMKDVFKNFIIFHLTRKEQKQMDKIFGRNVLNGDIEVTGFVKTSDDFSIYIVLSEVT